MTPKQRASMTGELSLEALLRGSLKDRMEIYAKATQNGTDLAQGLSHGSIRAGCGVTFRIKPPQQNLWVDSGSGSRPKL